MFLIFALNVPTFNIAVCNLTSLNPLNFGTGRTILGFCEKFSHCTFSHNGIFFKLCFHLIETSILLKRFYNTHASPITNLCAKIFLLNYLFSFTLNALLNDFLEQNFRHNPHRHKDVLRREIYYVLQDAFLTEMLFHTLGR